MKTKTVLKEVGVEFRKLEEKMGFMVGANKLYITRINSGATGCAKANKNAVGVTKELLGLWETNKDAVLFTLAHELAHIKYQDNRGIGLFYRLKGSLANEISYLVPHYHKFLAYILFMEMRANFEAASVLNLSDQENWKVQKCLERNNAIQDKKSCFKSGYPTRTMIIEYIAKYEEFDDSVKEALLLEFCEVREIKNATNFIEEAVMAF